MVALPCTVVLTLMVVANIAMVCAKAGEEIKTNNSDYDYMLKTEIEEAIKECGDSVETTGTEEFQKRSSNRGKRSYHVGGERKRRNLNIMMEQMHDYLKERSLEDSGSGEWDYGGGGGKKSTWEEAGDDKSSVDNGYQHDKRNNSYGTHYGHNGNGSRSYGEGAGESRSVQEQNSTRYNQNDVENNFDSRGAKLRPSAGIRERNNNFNANLTEEHRGTRSMRKRRSEGLVRAATQNEVDDRGIPKEGLFMKLIQETTTSQQMKILAEQQIKTCFHQLAGESQDDGCSYSNTLERCLGLEVRQRRDVYTHNDNVTTTTASQE